MLETGHIGFWFHQDLKLLSTNRLKREKQNKEQDVSSVNLEPVSNDGEEDTRLQLVHLVGLFLLFFCGLCLATIFFAGETLLVISKDVERKETAFNKYYLNIHFRFKRNYV